jgi:lipopolysaccharide export system protein LptC
LLTLKNFSITLLLLFALGLSAWSIIISHSSTGFANDSNDPTKADSYMEVVTALQFAKTGLPSIKLITPKMVHYPANDSTDIFAPHVTIFRKSPEPWYIESDFAKASKGINEILFYSNVNIHHPADTENPTTSLRTETLTIFPNQQLASTDQAVTFIQPDTTVHAIGMLANLDDSTIKLLSQAQGEYAPTS